jgi:hypothetical protein
LLVFGIFLLAFSAAGDHPDPDGSVWSEGE